MIGGFNAVRPQLAFKLNAKNYQNESTWEPSRQGLIVGIVCLVIAFTML